MGTVFDAASIDAHDGRGRRRVVVRTVLRSSLSVVVLLTAYFTLPMTTSLALGGVLALVGGLVAVVAVLAWQVRNILVAPFPAARAAAALMVSITLFVVVYASLYYLLGRSDPHSWTQSLTRIDALYFTVTVFSTVGFGDITPVSEQARLATTVQMVTGLILVGVVARVVVGAVQVNLQRRTKD